MILSKWTSYICYTYVRLNKKNPFINLKPFGSLVKLGMFLFFSFLFLVRYTKRLRLIKKFNFEITTCSNIRTEKLHIQLIYNVCCLLIESWILNKKLGKKISSIIKIKTIFIPSISSIESVIFLIGQEVELMSFHWSETISDIEIILNPQSLL